MSTAKKLVLAVVLTASVFLFSALIGVLANRVSDLLGINSIWLGVVLPIAVGVAGAVRLALEMAQRLFDAARRPHGACGPEVRYLTINGLDYSKGLA